MQQKYLKLWVGFLVVLTVVLYIWHKYGMDRSIHIDHFDDYHIWTFDDRSFGGGSISSMEKRGDEVVLSCKFSSAYTWPFCDLYIDVGRDGKGLDLSAFNKMELDITTSTNSIKPVRIYLRNYNSAYSKLGDHSTLKVNELDYTPSAESNPFVVGLDKFQVAIWWINEHNISPTYAESDLSNIVNIGIGFSQYDDEELHTLAIRSIRFHGKRLSYTQLQTIIIIIWLGSALIFLLLSFSQAQKAVLAMRKQKRELEEINAVLELERSEMENLATRDSLTGAYNRVGLRNHLHAQTVLVKQNHSALSLIFIDLDNYKAINDRCGHDCGDRVLQEFSRLIRKNTRSQDLFCRWGGDEFVLLCHGTPLDAAATLAEKLRRVVERHPWPAGLSITCSFGVAQMEPDDEIASFFRRADEAMYRAKAAGRNSVVSAGNTGSIDRKPAD